MVYQPQRLSLHNMVGGRVPRRLLPYDVCYDVCVRVRFVCKEKMTVAVQSLQIITFHFWHHLFIDVPVKEE